MEKLFGSQNKGLIFVLSAPAGTGKTTLVKKLTEENASIIRSISYTTREPRVGEVNGVDYHFIDKIEFEKRIQKGDFLEFAKVYENYYGTSKNWVESQVKTGKHVVLVIDTQGALLVKEKVEAVLIFVKPPSLEVLKHRLQSRNTEADSGIVERLNWAKNELEVGVEYDYCLVNDHLEVAYQVLKSIFIAEEHRIKKMIIRSINGKTV